MTFPHDASDGPVGEDDGYPQPSYFEAYHDGGDDFPHNPDVCIYCESAAQRAEEAKVF